MSEWTTWRKLPWLRWREVLEEMRKASTKCHFLLATIWSPLPSPALPTGRHQEGSPKLQPNIISQPAPHLCCGWICWSCIYLACRWAEAQSDLSWNPGSGFHRSSRYGWGMMGHQVWARCPHWWPIHRCILLQAPRHHPSSQQGTCGPGKKPLEKWQPQRHPEFSTTLQCGESKLS